MIKLLLQPVVRSETLNSKEFVEMVEIINIEDNFSSIDDRFEKKYSSSCIQYEDSSDEVSSRSAPVATGSLALTTSPYNAVPMNMSSPNPLKKTSNVATHHPFKRDPKKNPNYAEKLQMEKEERRKEKNAKILVRRFAVLLRLLIVYSCI